MATPTPRPPLQSLRRLPRAARGRRSIRARGRQWSTLLGNAAFVLLGLAVVALGAALIAMSQHNPHSSAASANGGATTHLAGSQMANVQAPPGEWIALRSTAPADILAAARRSSLFQQNLSGAGDHVSNLSRLGAPIYVQALQPAGAVAGQFPDFYVVPILNAAGAATDAAELELNPTHTAIQVIAIVTYSQPRARGAVAQVSADAGIAAVGAQQHSALRSGAAPQLVYFPADAVARETGQMTWSGGGEYPADPIWLIPGADGRPHLVGVDGRAYYQEQLPILQVGK